MWKPIATAPRVEDKIILVKDNEGRRFLAEWDDSAGHFQMVEALDGLEREKFFQEFGRIYGAAQWTEAVNIFLGNQN